MKKKMKEVAMHWRDKQDADIKVEFNHSNKGQNKSFKARITTDIPNPVLELVSFKGYNEKYVKRQISYYFNLFNTNLPDSVGSDDKILTRYAATNPPAVGSTVSLPSGTYYYSVNDGLVYCNGEQLGRQCTAIFIGYIIDRCSVDAEPVKYTKFKLQ